MPVQRQTQSDGSYTASCDACGRGELVGDADKAEFPSGEYATAEEAIEAARRAGFTVADEPVEGTGGEPMWPARCADHAEAVAP